MAISVIFISYSHEDEEYKDKLLRHLRFLEKQKRASFWDTSLIPLGADWSYEIIKAIDSAEFAILLVSSNFLASDYIVNNELPALLERAKSRNTIILPVLIRPCQWTAIPELAQFQFLNDTRTPVSSSNKPEEDYANISQKIVEIVLASREERKPIPEIYKQVIGETEETKLQDNRHVFLSHSKFDGDFAELLKLRLEREGITAWIDNDRLEAGVDWRQEIDESIKCSRALVAIMSPEARESEYVTYEWAFAWGTGIKLIPIMLRETPLHPRLATLQYLDFTNRRARPWDRLFMNIHNTKING